MSDIKPVVTKKALVKVILDHALNFEWTIQGLGMLRTYLDPEHTLRLHVWYPTMARVEDASELHTHPWDFDSFVVAGEVSNQRFVEIGEDPDNKIVLTPNQFDINRQTIRCGMGGGLVGESVNVVLERLDPERYVEGDRYHQDALEIHRTRPEDGTVTIIKRNFGTDAEHAFVYFEDEWGSAEPRPASPEEVVEITQYALVRWFR